MSDDLKLLATWAEALLTQLSPTQRRQLLYKIAQNLRRSQAQRIKSQQAPDGTTYTPRKHQKNLRGKQGCIKRQKTEMFTKLRTTRHLKTQCGDQQLTVGFVGRVARIARVHQEGMKDKVAKRGVEYQYPKRRLLGFNVNNHTLIREILMIQLGFLT